MTLSSQELGELVLTALAVLAIPGPSVLYVVGRAVTDGRRAAAVAVVGVDLGLLLQAVAVAVGLGSVLSGSDTALAIVKATGAALLVVLGVRAYRGRAALAARVRDGTAGDHAGRRVLRDGVLVGLVNPKRLLLLVVLLPQIGGGDASAARLLGLGAIVVAVGAVVDLAWGLSAGGARGWLQRRPRGLGVLGALAGAVMVGLGVRLALGI